MKSATKIREFLAQKNVFCNYISYRRIKSTGSLRPPLEVFQKVKQPNIPQFIIERQSLFERLYKTNKKWLEAQEQKPIKVNLPNGETVEGTSWRTTPFSLAKNNKEWKRSIVAKVNGSLWDLERPLTEDCSVEYLDFDTPEGKHVFWHSSAHILGESLEVFYEGNLCAGPPVENGFYYDLFLGDRKVVGSDLPQIEKLCINFIKQNQPFERLHVLKTDLLQMFKDNPFKLRIIHEKVTGDSTTVYRCGSLVDLCRGPHIRHSGIVGALAVTKNSSTYWEGNVKAESLQRVYAISFPSSKQLSEWKKQQEEAALRDHRKLGKEHDLFFFHELSPGSCFFFPKGAHIYHVLIQFLRAEYRKRGFQEVISPNMYKVDLWKTSGHLQNYAENMFMLDIEKEQFALKPMNCPGHCLMFAARARSWKELPLRYSDFGVIHRNEFSGALTGLTRVRRFCQDDAHIFCTLEQIKGEIKQCLEFLEYVYGILGFSMSLQLSTRPSNSIGDDSTWENAENSLKEALDEFKHDWIINPGDGAFYGPKIDVQVRDALGRLHQIGTVQLDFNLPERFKLRFTNSNDVLEQPVMIHRAILGSLERCIAILTETYAAKWPFWLSPNQVCIVSVQSSCDNYALEVKELLLMEGFHVDTSLDQTESLSKKVLNAWKENYNFIFVIGEKEKEKRTVNVRGRGDKKLGEKSIQEIIKYLKEIEKTFFNDSI